MVISDNGLFWSINCDNCDEPKNSLMAAATGFELIKSCGDKLSVSAELRRSLTARSTRTKPDTEIDFLSSHPLNGHGGLPKWSISSTSPHDHHEFRSTFYYVDNVFVGQYTAFTLQIRVIGGLIDHGPNDGWTSCDPRLINHNGPR